MILQTLYPQKLYLATTEILRISLTIGIYLSLLAGLNMMSIESSSETTMNLGYLMLMDCLRTRLIQKILFFQRDGVYYHSFPDISTTEESLLIWEKK